MRKTLWMSALVGIVLFGTYAMADNFYFSFTNTSGTVSGTVTGEIIGLTNNATGPATQVIITTYPAGLSPFETAPFDVLMWDLPFINTFTESAGSITAGEILAFDFSGPCATVAGGTCRFQLSVPPFSSFLANDQSGMNVIGNNASFQPAPVPEPSSAFLMSTALIAVACVSRKRIVQGLHF